MLETLSPFAKTMPSNYQVKPVEVDLASTPGETLTEEAWAKHERQCSPYYDWDDYRKVHENVNDTTDHPELAKKMKEKAEILQWSKLLDELEPFHR